MAAESVIYLGQGLSLQGDKQRFMLPLDIRKLIQAASANQLTLLLGKHEEWPCLIGAGTSYGEQLAAEIRSQPKHLLDKAQLRERHRRSLAMGNLFPVSFDSSGRFSLPAHLRKIGDIDKAIYIHGTLDFFTLWKPEVLMAQQGDEFVVAQEYCASALETARERKI